MTVSRERRATRRRRVLLAAQAFAAGCSQFMECTIRDLSCGGAAVRLAASAPDTFELRIPRDGSSRIAKTIWKDGDRRGLVFADVGTEITNSGKTSIKTSILDLRRLLQFEAVPQRATRAVLQRHRGVAQRRSPPEAAPPTQPCSRAARGAVLVSPEPIAAVSSLAR